MPQLHRRALLGIALCAALGAGGALAEPINQADGVTLKGYDPVAYFIDGAPAKGDPAITADWNGATWHFATEANRDRFVRTPEAFAPQYGGFCAWAVSQDYLAPVDPEAWRIVDGRLYLNYSRRVQRTWEKDIPGNIVAATANWPGLQQ